MLRAMMRSASGMRNTNITAARRAKQDEFYTQLVDIENELQHYTEYFAGKVVLCNCDNPRSSNFFRYFVEHFERLKLKKLIVSFYKNGATDLFSGHSAERGGYLEYEGAAHGQGNVYITSGIRDFQGDGDFRSADVVALLAQADIVVTNPPFSLFRVYVSQMVKHNKKFLVVGHLLGGTQKETFPLIKDNKMWLGRTNPKRFMIPDHYPVLASSSWRAENGLTCLNVSGVYWWTNLGTPSYPASLPLSKSYDKTAHPTYDNYEAIEISKTVDIPSDYAGVMGVPVSFLPKYNPAQFDLIGSAGGSAEDGVYSLAQNLCIDGNLVFKRLLIINKNPKMGER